MRLFITGWSGFIGKNLLADVKFGNHELVCWRRPDSTDATKIPQKENLTFIEGNISPSLMYGIDAVINLAGRVHRMRDNPKTSLTENRAINRDFPLALAKSAIDAGVGKFIHLSTVKVMGEGMKNSGEPYIEDDATCPLDSYGISKLEAEIGLHKLFDGKKSTCTILRLPMVYGPHNKGNMLTLLKVASKGIPLPLKNADGKRSMIYVKNVVDAILTLLETKQPVPVGSGVYFISDGNDLTSGELYSIISSRYSGKDKTYYLPKSFLKLSGQLGSLLGLPLNSNVISRLLDAYRFSNEKFSSIYSWTPPYNPSEGINETVDWYKTKEP